MNCLNFNEDLDKSLNHRINNTLIKLYICYIGVQCLSWSSNGMACQSVENEWKTLDVQMDASQAKQCQVLCSEQHESGCCFLENGRGCYWLKGSHAIEVISGSGTATTCNLISTLFSDN